MKKVLGSHKLLGIVFLGLIVGGVWLTAAIFSKAFTDYEEVELEASSAGLSLPARADVKIRGVQVGEVLEARSEGDRAVLTLGLYPDKVDTIPANVTARIEPKTLFGEKYVALQVPEQPESRAIRAGDRITQTVVATEVEEALNDLYPLLRTVEPIELNHTITAVATALEGRGEALGDSLDTLDGYLKRMNPQLPELVEDIRLAGETAEVYNEVIPELASILRNSVTTTNTLEEREQKLDKLFDDVSRFSAVTGKFLDDNEENLIRVGELGARTLKVVGEYAPGFPCLTNGIVEAGRRQGEVFRGFTLHIVLEVIPNQPRAYTAADKPVFGEKNRGPYCGSLPDSPYSQQNPFRNPPNFNDGINSPTGKGTMRALPGFEMSTAPGSPAEADLARGLLAAHLGQDSDEVSDLGVLMFAPMLRGTEVSLR